MSSADLERILEIAASLQQAPHWPAAAYVAAIDLENTPRRIALVVEDLTIGSVTGLAVASVLPPEAELETIAVAAEGQRRGLGSLLLESVAKELRSEKVSRLILEVRASNHAALRFYRTQGFEETGRRPRYYADPEEDAVLMELRLG
jgi:ribosomal-protein-alanine N-acetyltransferase